jgi:hypothetical protein
VLGGFDGGDVAGLAGEHGAQVFARFAEQPPVVAQVGAVLVAFRFDAFEHPLIGAG